MGKVGVGYDSAEKLPLYDSYGMFVSTGRCTRGRTQPGKKILMDDMEAKPPQE
jgi:hypothetical protein